MQGNDGAFSHTGIEQYAWDFALPTGSVVTAARGGTVRFVNDGFNVGGPLVNVYGDAGNYVVIDHGDGTSGLYLHLMYHGALVQPGQHVQQGQPIAYSGSTGFASGPHLHFMVEQTTNAWYSQSLAIGFADIGSNQGVPVQGGTYTSGNGPFAYWHVSNPVPSGTLPPISVPLPIASPVAGLQGTGELLSPVSGPLLTAFGTDHPGLDLAAPAGSAVLAVDTGTVVYAGGDPTGGVGHTVEVDHGDGLQSVYTHLIGVTVKPGAIVARGEQVGVAGSLLYGLPSFATVAILDHGGWVDPLPRLRAYLPAPPTPRIALPNLVGRTVAQAKAALASSGMQVALDPAQPSTTVPAGSIAAQAPAAGSLAPIGATIRVAPSGGQPTPTPQPSPAPTEAAAAIPTPTHPVTGAAHTSSATSMPTASAPQH